MFRLYIGGLGVSGIRRFGHAEEITIQCVGADEAL